VEVSQRLLALALLYSAGVGAVLGVLYDVFRIMRVAMKPSQKMPAGLRAVYNVIGDAIIFFEDILFSIVASVVVTVFLFHINNGQVRWFVLAGAGIGFALYYITVGRLVIMCAEAIISFIRALIHFILSLTLFPAARAIRFIGRLLTRLLLHLGRRLYTVIVLRRIIRQAERGFK
jgi:spore cortex biosynthesis protein YabQ